MKLKRASDATSGLDHPDVTALPAGQPRRARAGDKGPAGGTAPCNRLPQIWDIGPPHILILSPDNEHSADSSGGLSYYVV